MILFIAPNPHKQKKIEGYLQRVLAIDQLFNGKEKIYSSDIKNKRSLVELIAIADLIYVHSVYKAKDIIYFYDTVGYKIITDLHGIVPEEEYLSGHKGEAKILNGIEKTVFKYGFNFVAVTQSMVDFYKEKYKNYALKNWIVLPIYNKQLSSESKITIAKFNAINIVYSGGAQKWQNVELMADVINSHKNNYNYIILSQEKKAFDQLIKAHSNVLIKKVNPSEVAQYYSKCIAGFVLRDDVSVNRVSCPTKLIEYLSFGIVPIVKLIDLGDFRNLGYKYVTLNDFLNKKLEQKTLIEYAKENKKVVTKLKNIEVKGKNKILIIYDKLLSLNREEHQNIKQLVEFRYRIQIQSEKINKLKAENKNQESEIANLKKSLESIKKSKRWMIANSVTVPVKGIRKIRNNTK